MVYARNNDSNKLMNQLNINTNSTIFLLFFGGAALEAILSAHWTEASIWVAIGIAFLLVPVFRLKNLYFPF